MTTREAAYNGRQSAQPGGDGTPSAADMYKHFANDARQNNRAVHGRQGKSDSQQGGGYTGGYPGDDGDSYGGRHGGQQGADDDDDGGASAANMYKQFANNARQNNRAVHGRQGKPHSQQGGDQTGGYPGDDGDSYGEGHGARQNAGDDDDEGASAGDMYKQCAKDEIQNSRAVHGRNGKPDSQQCDGDDGENLNNRETYDRTSGGRQDPGDGDDDVASAADMYKQYANDARQNNRAVHGRHGKPGSQQGGGHTGGYPGDDGDSQGGGYGGQQGADNGDDGASAADLYKQFANDARQNNRAVHGGQGEVDKQLSAESPYAERTDAGKEKQGYMPAHDDTAQAAAMQWDRIRRYPLNPYCYCEPTSIT